jgi:hypothetical protein
MILKGVGCAFKEALCKGADLMTVYFEFKFKV